MRKIIIALDGFSGTGKSSTAREVAKVLGYTYIDSGAMYRAATLYFLESDVNIQDAQAVNAALDHLEITFKEERVLLNGQDVTDQIRSMKVNEHVSTVSTIPNVRKELVSQQQRMGRGKGIVMDGRDIGTVVFPDAELKIFMVADSRVRARRRQLELEEKGIFGELKVIEDNLLERDKIDSTRNESPLKRTDESVEIDTSGMSFDEQVQEIVGLAKQLIYEN